MAWCQQPPLGRDLLLNRYSSPKFSFSLPCSMHNRCDLTQPYTVPLSTFPCRCYAALRYRHIDSTRSTRVRLYHDLTRQPTPRLTPHAWPFVTAVRTWGDRRPAAPFFKCLRRGCRRAVAGWLAVFRLGVAWEESLVVVLSSGFGMTSW